MALTSTDWLLSSGWRQGLFTHCIEDLTQPIPFNVEAKEEGCYPSRDVCKYYTPIQMYGVAIRNIVAVVFGIRISKKRRTLCRESKPILSVCVFSFFLCSLHKSNGRTMYT